MSNVSADSACKQCQELPDIRARLQWQGGLAEVGETMARIRAHANGELGLRRLEGHAGLHTPQDREVHDR